MAELTVTRNKIEFGNSWGPGVHTEYVIHHILSGKGYYEVGEKKYTLTKGDSFIIFPGSIVNYYADENDPWTYAWVNFIGGDAKKYISMTAFPDHPISHKNDLSDIFRMFSEEIRESHSKIYNEGVLKILLSRYIESYPSKKTESGPNYIDVAKQYIASNMHRQEFTVGELADAVGLERSYLYRLFKESEGVSVSEFIINARLESAKEMLEGGITQIKVISFSSGYDNPLYFSNAFKKKYGVSPKNYIKNLR